MATANLTDGQEQGNGPPKGPPYGSTAAVFGGIPTLEPDDIVSGVLLFLFAMSAVAHLTVLHINLRNKIKFIFSAMLAALCLLRCVALAMRIAWTANPHSIKIAIAANILTQAGSVLVFIVNLKLSQRVLRAYHPRFGWSLFGRLIFIFCLACVVLSLIIVIAFTIQSFFTLDQQMRHIDHTIQLVAGTYLAVLAFLPLPILFLSWIIPSLPAPRALIGDEPVPATDEKTHAQRGQPGRIQEKFGSGRWRTKLQLLIFASSLATLGAAFRIGINFEPRPPSNPGWALSKPCFYVFNFVLDLLVSNAYLLARFDRRFLVPDGAKKPGDYGANKEGLLVPEPEVPLVGCADGAASPPGTPSPALLKETLKDSSASTEGSTTETTGTALAPIIAIERAPSSIAHTKSTRNKPKKTKSTARSTSRAKSSKVENEAVAESSTAQSGQRAGDVAEMTATNLNSPRRVYSRQVGLHGQDYYSQTERSSMTESEKDGHSRRAEDSKRIDYASSTTAVSSGQPSSAINNGQLDGGSDVCLPPSMTHERTHKQPRRARTHHHHRTNRDAFAIDGELLFPPPSASSVPSSPRASIVARPTAEVPVEVPARRRSNTQLTWSPIYHVVIDTTSSDPLDRRGQEHDGISKFAEIEGNGSGSENGPSRVPSGYSLQRMQSPIKWLALNYEPKPTRSDAGASTDSDVGPTEDGPPPQHRGPAVAPALKLSRRATDSGTGGPAAAAAGEAHQYEHKQRRFLLVPRRGALNDARDSDTESHTSSSIAAASTKTIPASSEWSVSSSRMHVQHLSQRIRRHAEEDGPGIWLRGNRPFSQQQQQQQGEWIQEEEKEDDEEETRLYEGRVHRFKVVKQKEEEKKKKAIENNNNDESGGGGVSGSDVADKEEEEEDMASPPPTLEEKDDPNKKTPREKGKHNREENRRTKTL